MSFVWTLILACGGPAEQVIIVHTVDSTSTTTTTTTTSSSTTDTTSSTSSPDPDGPRIDTFDVTELPTLLEVTVSLREGTAPLEGGTLYVDYDGAGLALAIPDDLTSFAGRSATFLLDRPMVGLCTEGVEHTVAVEVVDAGARSSGTVVTELTTTDVGLILDEIGESQAWILPGFLSADLLLCGELDSTGHSGGTYTADIDFVGFEVDPTDPWTFRLDWDEIANYDLLLYQLDTLGYIEELDAAVLPDVHGPELLDRRLYRNEQYVLGVAGRSGPGGVWSITVQ